MKAKRLIAGIAAMMMLCSTAAANITAFAEQETAPDPLAARLALYNMLMNCSVSNFSYTVDDPANAPEKPAAGSTGLLSLMRSLPTSSSAFFYRHTKKASALRRGLPEKHSSGITVTEAGRVTFTSLEFLKSPGASAVTFLPPTSSGIIRFS